MNDRISELKQEYFKVSQAKRLMLLCLALAVFLVIFWSLNIGPSKVNLKTVFDVIIDLFEPNEALTNGERVIVLRVRLPRICASILAGILLACSGLLMQGVFQNPLVSPYTMGDMGSSHTARSWAPRRLPESAPGQAPHPTLVAGPGPVLCTWWP